MRKVIYSALLALAAIVPNEGSASWSDYVIILDPGHGGDDCGAVYDNGAYSNQTESWLVFQCASNVYNKLSSLGAEVYMTRWQDDFDGEIDLSPRRAYCYTYGSDVFVSFHLNAANASAHGTETWYYYDGSYNLATCVQNGLMSKFGEVDGTGGYEMINRGIKNNGWTVITAGDAYPSVLTEGLFIDCYTDWQLIQDTASSGFYAWVDGHLKGIYDYLSGYGYYSVSEPTYYGGGGGGGTVSTPYIAVSTNNVYLQCEAGQTATATVQLEGNKLNGWCYVTPTDKCKGVFSVSPTGLNVAGYPDYNFADENPTVTITFTPDKVGEWSGDQDGDGYNDYVITLKSVDTDGNDVYQWINLNGTATAPPLSFSEKWNFSDKAGTLTQMGWDASKVRNMAYYNGKLYLVYEQSYIKVVDARTGRWLYDLNSEGIEGGLVTLCDVRPFDGKIVGCNIGGIDASGNQHDLKIYVWENATDAPKVTTISYATLAANNIVRLGDYIEVGGAWSGIDGSRIIFACDNYGKVSGVTGGTYIVEFPVSNGEIGTSPSNIVEVTADGAYLPAKSSIRAYPTMYGYMINGASIPATKIGSTGSRLDYMSGFKTWGNAYRQFDYDGTTYAFILDFNDGVYSTTDSNGYPSQTAEDAAKNYTGGHAKLLQITSSDWSYTFFSPKNMSSYPAATLSDTRQNMNCTGNIQLNQDGDNYVEMWLLSTNQGIAYYYTGNAPESEYKEPSLSASATSLTFSAEYGSSDEKTVNITGVNLSSDISVAVSGDGAENWSVSHETMTGSGVLSITYSPKEIGNHIASVTLTAEGAEDVVISLVGNCYSEEQIDGYEFVQDWKHTESHLTANSASRWATGFDGKIYVNDHANSKLYNWTKDGITDTGISSCAGTAITNDDAGNILIPSSYFAAGMTTLKVLPAGGTTFSSVSLTFPDDITANQMQYMGKAIGDVMSEEGGAVFMFVSGSTKVAKFIIANGVQKSVSSIDVSEITADGQSIAIPLTNNINSDEIAARARQNRHFYTNTSGSFVALEDNGITTTQGGTLFTSIKTLFAIEPVGDAYLDGFQIVNVKENSIVAKHDAELTTPACKPNANCISAEEVSHGIVRIYQYVPGQYAAQYTLTIQVSDGVDNVHVPSAKMQVSVDGNVLRVSGVNAEAIDVYSISGSHVASIKGTQEIAINNLTRGFYLVRVIDEGGMVHSAKFCK